MIEARELSGQVYFGSTSLLQEEIDLFSKLSWLSQSPPSTYTSIFDSYAPLKQLLCKSNIVTYLFLKVHFLRERIKFCPTRNQEEENDGLGGHEKKKG